VPALKAAIEDLKAGRLQAGWEKLESHGVIKGVTDSEALRETQPMPYGRGDNEAGRIVDIQVFPRIPSETRVSFVPILIEWMKRGRKIGRSAPFSAFSPLRRRIAATGLC
jgi:hypothetical protein